ncbi:dihydropteroate synthase [[Clostridium] fimetarium]|uniref:Dihydropteroate synthase n=1 Tax=[Clostridium] fimetarium TaxID=99656 RepID=A0A1I0PKF0_9FIRM|nr:dihydropteroate synthase [[Clostridium] fimetarium]SEW14832.1 dihydropteroate synthase [[Clostridium] fimetarium]
MIIGKKEFDVKNRTYVMGILNITPDSFSDGGKYNQFDNALRHVENMITDGADIIDVGGESTRPGYQKISDNEEIERVVPVIEAIKRNFDIPISLDTYKSQVALEGIKAGADLINDIWGLKYDNNMAFVIAQANVCCCLMHNRETINYNNFMKDLETDLGESLNIAKKAGIANDKIILDPGVGFAKTYEMNIEIIHNLEQLHMFGLPILLGTSRKSVIGLALNLPAEQRLEGTLATTVIGVIKHCAFVRVHDILENSRVIKMTEAILQ